MFKEKDKVGHFIAGVSIYFAVSIISFPFVGIEKSMLMGLASAFLAGIAKEIWDSYHPKTNTADMRDFTATAIGGLVAISIEGLIHGIGKLL